MCNKTETLGKMLALKMNVNICNILSARNSNTGHLFREFDRLDLLLIGNVS